MDLNLSGRSALITGGSKGIGRAIAERLAAEGCRLNLVARSPADLEQAAAELTSRHGVAVQAHVMDLAARGCAATLAARCPALDILVNNAGSTPRGTLVEVDDERWRAAFDLKLYGYIDLTRHFYAQM